MNLRFQFLLAAIQDTQGTIRALDQKASFVLVICALPLTQSAPMMAGVFNLLHQDLHAGRYILETSLVLTVLVWLFSVILALGVLVAANNPARLIKQLSAASGGFYAGDLFEPSARACCWDRDLLSKKSLEDHLQRLPVSEEDVDKELAFEQMKLAFIRTNKIYLLNRAIALTGVWIALTLFCWTAAGTLKAG